MNEYIAKTFEHNGYTVKIIADHDAESPRDWDNVGTMVCWHSRYNLGDEQRRDNPDDWFDELAESVNPGFIDRWDNYHFRRIVTSSDYQGPVYKTQRATWESKRHAARQRILDANFVMLPLGLYDHSGISMYIGSESIDIGGWDSGQVGWIYCTREKAIAEFGGKSKRFTKRVRRMTEKCLHSEVETYDQFLTGDVWGYVIEDPDENDVASCWGFFGIEYCKQEAITACPETPALKHGESEDESHEETLA